MIYYVEDDLNIRELVVYTLNQMNLPARGFESAVPFWDAMTVLPDLILLDIMLPGEDGLQILRRLRADQTTAEIPVIMITAKGAEFDKVQGLDLGADDYLSKPFGMAELVARVRARLRRVQKKTDNTLHIGPLSIDRDGRIVRVDGETIPLTLKEYDLLCLLIENRGRVFKREQLLEKVWDWGYDGGTRTVDVHIQTLRAKLGPCANLIETVRGVGYRAAAEPAKGGA